MKLVFLEILLSAFFASSVNGFTFDETCLATADAPDSFSTEVTVPVGTNMIVGNLDPVTDIDFYRYYYDGSIVPLTIETTEATNSPFFKSPLLTLYNSSKIQIAQNDDWDSTCDQIPGIAMLSRDSCITATLTPGFYYISIETSRKQFNNAYTIFISVPANPPVGATVDCATPSPSTVPTSSPTRAPSLSPSRRPTPLPTRSPSSKPTKFPTKKPSPSPTTKPLSRPTTKPSPSPTSKPSSHPTNKPSQTPTRRSSPPSTKKPSQMPSNAPSKKPTNPPTTKPINAPTTKPTNAPSRKPLSRLPPQPSKTSPPTLPSTRRPLLPTVLPTNNVPAIPTKATSPAPTGKSTLASSHVFSDLPSKSPSQYLNLTSAKYPTIKPSHKPTQLITLAPNQCSHLTLVNASAPATGIGQLCSGDTLSSTTSYPISVRYDPPRRRRISKVRFHINGTRSKPKDETGAPYSIMGGRNGNYNR